MCTVIDKDSISINDIKFDEMTVIFQFKNDTTPTISINENMQLESAIAIQIGLLKIR